MLTVDAMCVEYADVMFRTPYRESRMRLQKVRFTFCDPVDVTMHGSGPVKDRCCEIVARVFDLLSSISVGARVLHRELNDPAQPTAQSSNCFGQTATATDLSDMRCGRPSDLILGADTGYRTRAVMLRHIRIDGSCRSALPETFVLDPLAVEILAGLRTAGAMRRHSAGRHRRICPSFFGRVLAGLIQGPVPELL